MHFSDDMVFFIFPEKKENCTPSSFFFFFSDENQDIYFRGLRKKDFFIENYKKYTHDFYKCE